MLEKPKDIEFLEALPDEKKIQPAEELKLDDDSNLQRFYKCSDPSWVNELDEDSKADVWAPNKTSREVKSGHYVQVKPTPLPKPYLVTYSHAMANELRLSETTMKSEKMVRWLTGSTVFKETFPITWATPYALSIFGQIVMQNCPFGTGNGYGDGRAISIAEVVVPETGKRWELQLKGAGTTPWCRGGDGRAVLRSSVREFLASEAMFFLGCGTTRALSLSASATEKVQRQWYSGKSTTTSMDNIPPSLAFFFQDRLKNPDIVLEETCAITCRVSPSFARVGHFELFHRRAEGIMRGDKTLGKKQLLKLFDHVWKREYPDLYTPNQSTRDSVISFLIAFRERLTKLVANWIRVGYVQSNFNSDNCLVGGRTMDYGPFGFIEKYNRNWCMWTGGGQKFGFMNQPKAGSANFISLAVAMTPLVGDDIDEIKKIVKGFSAEMDKEIDDTFRRKFGLSKWTPEAKKMWDSIENAMHDSGIVDYTIFFRQLAKLVKLARTAKAKSDDELFEPLTMALYKASPSKHKEVQDLITKNLRTWLEIIADEARPEQDVIDQMNTANPKYIPREWMLADAYKAAYKGDFKLVQELYKLFENPYGEQTSMEEKYYRRAPEEASGTGGIGFMT